MRRFIKLPALLLLTFLAAHGSADVSSITEVIVHIQPIVHITRPDAMILVESIGVGVLTISTDFRIDANVPSLHMYVEATDLYMDGLARDPSVAPIPLSADSGVRISPADASPVASAGNVASFVEQCALGEFPARRSEMIHFLSSQTGIFSQDISVTVTWNQDDPTKPAGRYIGKIKFAAIHLP